MTIADYGIDIVGRWKRIFLTNAYSVRNAVLRYVIDKLQRRAMPVSWKLNPSRHMELRYVIHDLPFAFQLCFSKPAFGEWPVHMSRRWFTLNGIDEGPSNSDRRYVATLEADTFRLQRADRNGRCLTDIAWRKSDALPFSDVRLNGVTYSPFERCYPSGVGITDFAKYLFSAKIESAGSSPDGNVTLEDVLPFILHNASDYENCFESEDLFLTILDDDTCDIYTIRTKDTIHPLNLESFDRT